MLGIKAQFHISHYPRASGQLEWTNQTIISMLKVCEYVVSNQKDWDVRILSAYGHQRHLSQIHRSVPLWTDNKMTNDTLSRFTNLVTPASSPHIWPSNVKETSIDTWELLLPSLNKTCKDLARARLWPENLTGKTPSGGQHLQLCTTTRNPKTHPKNSWRISYPIGQDPMRWCINLSPVAYWIKKTKQGTQHTTLKWTYCN